MVISPDGQKIAEENGFVEMPSALVNLAKQAIQMVQWPDDMVPFTFETEDGTAFTPAKTQKELGMQPRVISAKRTCYGDYERKQMLVKVNELNSDSFASSSSLNDVQQSLADGLSTRDARISALEAQLEDNDDEDDQTATFAKATFVHCRPPRCHFPHRPSSHRQGGARARHHRLHLRRHGPRRRADQEARHGRPAEHLHTRRHRRGDEVAYRSGQAACRVSRTIGAAVEMKKPDDV